MRLVGAGVAGLSCAPVLTEAGLAVKVVESARGVGGHSATRRMDGPPVDFGVAFLHGRHPDFLALAPEQAATQLEALAYLPQVASSRAVLGLVRSQACLVVRALYPVATPVPEWQVLYPETSTILQMISHDSTKRRTPRRPALVFQAHPACSRAHLEDPGCPGLMLAEAEQLLGPWVAQSELREPHRWRLARSDRSAELAQPMLLELLGGARVLLYLRQEGHSIGHAHRGMQREAQHRRHAGVEHHQGHASDLIQRRQGCAWTANTAPSALTRQSLRQAASFRRCRLRS